MDNHSHAIFQIDEIIRLIFWLAHPGHRESLAFAVTCKKWYEPGIDTLYSEIPDYACLFTPWKVDGLVAAVKDGYFWTYVRTPLIAISG